MAREGTTAAMGRVEVRRRGYARRAAVFGGLALAVPLLAAPGLASTASPSASSAVRLTTSITLLQSTPDASGELSTYEITVRPDGGTATGTQVQLAADAPARWQDYSARCQQPAHDGTRLACGLGDLHGPASVRATLAVPADAGRLGMLAVTHAENVPAQETAAVLPVPSPETPAATARSAPHRQPRAPRAVRPPAPIRRRTPEPRPMIPRAPVLRPIQPVQPGLVNNGPQYSNANPDPGSGSTPPPSTGSGLGLPELPSSSPVVVSPSPSVSALPSALPSADPVQGGTAAGDTSQLSLVTASDVPGSHAAWVKVLGIVVVAEVAVLWLATSLGLWRRRMAAAAAAAAPGVGRTAPAPKRPGLIGRLAGALPRPSFRR